MRHYFTSFFCRVGFVLVASSVSAQEVSLDSNGLTLLADFIEVEGTSGPVALITHGTLAHKDMELVESLQEALAEEGVSSLAHTLSLGLNARRGMFDCEQTHRHRDEDADAEIALWIDWLHSEGHERIALVGHSRGGKQVARTAATRDDLSAVVLIAPITKANGERAFKRSPTLEGEVLKSGNNGEELTVKTPSFLHCGPTQVTFDSHASYHPNMSTGAETFVENISAPVLVIAGSKDRVVPEVPATFIPLLGESLSFKLIEDAGHMFLDFHVDDAAMLIAEFLTDLPETRSGPDFAQADLAYGEYLGSECLGCHAGGDGIPPIAGGDAEYLFEALNEYADGTRENAAMRLVARSLDDEQRIAVSAYFASLEFD